MLEQMYLISFGLVLDSLPIPELPCWFLTVDTRIRFAYILSGLSLNADNSPDISTGHRREYRAVQANVLELHGNEARLRRRLCDQLLELPTLWLG